MARQWTVREIALLKDTSLTNKQLHSRLDRTPMAINEKRYTIGVRLTSGKSYKWPEWVDKALMDRSIPIKDIAAKIELPVKKIYSRRSYLLQRKKRRGEL